MERQSLAVKTAKKLLRKAKDAKTDPYLAILDCRNTPTQGIDSSPAQRLMNRRTKTLLPMVGELLKPRNVQRSDEKEKLELRQKKQAEYYNRSAKDLQPLKEGEKVRMKPFVKGRKEWQEATVTRRLDERSYEVENPAGTYRRNKAIPSGPHHLMHQVQHQHPRDQTRYHNHPDRHQPYHMSNRKW